MHNKTLVTGGQGFLGQYIVQALVYCDTLGRAKSNTYNHDLSKGSFTLPEYKAVVHAAGKAHSRPSTKRESELFYSINAEGTRNLLSSLAANPPSRIVYISTVAVYGLERGLNIDEDQDLLGIGPYAESKILAEQMVEKWCREKGCAWLILRLPLVAGINPPGNLGAMINAIRKGRFFRIAKGEAKRSMVHAEDVAALIKQWIDSEKPVSGIYNLTDGYHPAFAEIEQTITKELGSNPVLSIPYTLASFLSFFGEYLRFMPFNRNMLIKMTSNLTFNDEKARKDLGWNPKKALDRKLILS